MKKILIFLVILMLSTSTVVLAAYDTGDVPLGSGANSLTISTSNQVQLDYAAGGTNGETFVLGSYHDKGTRTYMSSSEDAVIYYDENTTTAIPAAPSTGSSVDSSSFSKQL